MFRLCLGYFVLGIISTLAIFSFLIFWHHEKIYVLNSYESNMINWSRQHKNLMTVLIGQGSNKLVHHEIEGLPNDKISYYDLREMMRKNSYKENLFITFSSEDETIKNRNDFLSLIYAK